MLLAAAQGYRTQFPLPDLTVPSGWGMNIHFTEPQPGEMDRLAASGVRWIRIDLFWHQVERRKGEYDFSGYDRLTTALKSKGIRPVYILCYGNDLYQSGSPRTPEARAAFCRFVAAAVRRYRGQGVIWEMWNEPNIHFWSPRPNVEEYVALAKDVARTLRTVAPDEWHVGPAVSGFDWGFLRRCFEAGLLNRWDAVTVHPYRPLAPETVAADWARLRTLMDRYSPAKRRIPMLSGEWGYTEVAAGMGPERQARYAARMYLANLASGVPLTILYDWRDDGEDPKEGEHHFGTVTHRTMEPKPSYRAIQHLTRELAGYTYHLRLALSSREDVLLAFRKGSGVKLVAYTTRPEPTPVRLPVGRAAFRVSRPSGTSSLAAGAAFGLTEEPAVLTATQSSDALRAIARLRPLPTSRSYREPSDAAAIVAESAPRGSGRVEYRVEREDGASAWTRAGAPAAVPSLGLGAKPSYLRVRTVLPDGTALVQETALTAERPLSLSPALDLHGLVAFVGNPEGRTFKGEVVVRRGSETRRVPVTVAADQATKTVPLPTVPSNWLKDGFDVALRTGGRDVVAVRGVVLERLPAFAQVGQPLEKEYRLEFDGDPKVKAEVTGEGVRLMGRPIGPGTALRIRYEMAPGWKYLMLKPVGDARGRLAGRPQALGMWVRGDGSGDMLRMRFVDETDQTFQPDYGPIDWKGWRYVSFALDGAAAGRWGGANDGVVHYPIRIDSVVLVDSKGGGRPSEIMVMAPSLVGSSQRTVPERR
jgi:hypothetical protein